MYFQRLRDLREDADLTQTEVAKLLFTSQTVYSRYERGVLTIPVEHLLILADFYDVSVDYILGRTNIKKVRKKSAQRTNF
ncbi:MAG: helix-turn-helix domain-containing protein [Ruminococcus sp.]|nr:helix-turn-helix domain-containing protein [Ruminococcus sp.]